MEIKPNIIEIKRKDIISKIQYVLLIICSRTGIFIGLPPRNPNCQVCIIPVIKRIILNTIRIHIEILNNCMIFVRTNLTTGTNNISFGTVFIIEKNIKIRDKRISNLANVDGIVCKNII
jgi:hypothetical protein